MRHHFRFEYQRLKNLFFAATLVAFAIVGYLIFSGYSDFQLGKEKDAALIDSENLREQNYTTYVQYANEGVEILNLLPNINILFFPQKFVLSDRGHIHNNAILKIYQDKRGIEKIRSSEISTFAIFLLALIIIVSIFTAMTTVKSLKNVMALGKFKNVIFSALARFSLLLIFLLLTFAFTLVAVYFTVPFQKIEIQNCMFFLLNAILLSALFFWVSILSSLFDSQKKKVLSLIVFNGLILIIFPVIVHNISIRLPMQISYVVSAKKVHQVLKFEQRGKSILKDTAPAERYEVRKKLAKGFTKNEYKNIQELEKDLLADESRGFDTIQIISMFSPVSYYFVICEYVSGASNTQYLEFAKYCDRKQTELLHFFVDKRFNLIPPDKTGKVEPFLKPGENTFKSKSQQPEYYNFNTIINLIYLFFVIGFTAIRLKKIFTNKDREKDEAQKIISGIDSAKANFIKARMPVERNDLFYSMKSKNSDWIYLDRISRTDFFNTKLRYLFDLHSSVHGVNKEKFKNYCGIFHLPGNILNKKIMDIEELDFRRFWAAMTLANDSQVIVLNDFAQEGDLEFAANFFSLIKHINTVEKRGIVYISVKIYTPLIIEETIKQDSDVKGFKKYIPVDLNESTRGFQDKVVFN
ncbi:MAG: hypothetical protein KAW12_07015 [Candidatus Aminicenantes bacterium]|nr:hypothetical protein [Candidatus Aminicenantes bacterium]